MWNARHEPGQLLGKQISYPQYNHPSFNMVSFSSLWCVSVSYHQPTVKFHCCWGILWGEVHTLWCWGLISAFSFREDSWPGPGTIWDIGGLNLCLSRVRQMTKSGTAKCKANISTTVQSLWPLIIALFSTFLMMDDIENFVLCLLAFCIYDFRNLIFLNTSVVAGVILFYS